MDAIIWNVRSVNTMQAFERLITMHRKHHFEFIGILDPMQQSHKMERYRARIGLAQAVVNVSNKIWAFIDEIFEVTILYNMTQQLTLRLMHTETHVELILTLVYAKCDHIERIELWDSLYAMASDMIAPWLVGGDFNMIWDEEEKFGRLPVFLIEVDDFRHCINTCNLTDLGFKRSIFTWWNGRSEDDCIFKRLDRCLGNHELQQTFPGLEVTHLSKIGSDHYPMMLKCDIETPPIKKSFRFLNFWTKHETFKDLVKENWNADFSANPFCIFNFKLKKLKKELSTWSRATYGDIFQKIASLEEVVLVHERHFQVNPTQMNRQRLQQVQAEMIKYLALEEEFWRQKAGMLWFKYGDRNTKFFHTQVNGRRKRLKLSSNQNSLGNWIEEDHLIAEEAISFYKDQFAESAVPNDFDILNHVPSMVDSDQHERLMALPSNEELKRAVMRLNGDSADGPDGFTGAFYQTCWEIIEEDVVKWSRLSFAVNDCQRVLRTQTWVIHERLVELLPNIISEEQAGFVKGRSIVENVLLTQEIITDIRLRTKAGPNVVIKLDMEKAYDRLSWLFLTNILRKMGFPEAFIGLIFDLIGNNWYSVLINGQPNGFFKSSMGVKQGDPLSPTLFILAAEALFRGLNSLHTNLYFCGFGMPKWSPKINHLSYADGTIIFCSSDETSLRLVMEVLQAYESSSSQQVNKTKSATYMHHLTDNEVINKVERITEYPNSYVVSINPPNYVINKLYSIFAKFFWSSNIGGSTRHWASWTNLCMPFDEGGIGFRSLHDVSKALFCKLWWNFRTKPTLWSAFICQKYCKKLNAVIVPWKCGSRVWRKMLECRDLIEHQIYWKLRMGSAQFWFDNWTEIGALYFQVPADFGIDEDIHNNIRPPTDSSQLDTPFWMLETKGHFTVKFAWDYLRRRVNPKLAYKMIWVKGLPFKISLFLWKVWKAKLSLDDILRKIGYSIPSKCWCCADPKEESLVHLFFTSNAARSVWSYFLRRAGIALDRLSLHQAITKCWTTLVVPILKQVLQALPTCIVWELWKRRNSLKYGDAVSVSRVIYLVSSTLQALVQLKKPGLHVPHKWLDLLTMMEQYTPRLKYDKVLWEFPSRGWIKVNTDGACRGNPEGREISEGTNNESEAVAIVEALKMCKIFNFGRIWLQTGSMLLKNIIEESWKPPWYTTKHVKEILILKEQSNIKVTHIFKEGNTLADHIANYALDEGNTECHGFWDLDSKGRRIINEDKMQWISSKLKPNLIVESEMMVGMQCFQSTGRTLKMGLRTFTTYLTTKGSNAIA
uniref:RNase H type-1 domain-containing protein n=1 Tax=Nicotiana tabacum TaxID=4097 RepID=A0A1S4AF07_TOBAC|nr:PREDICTED: uncharacterized protein LOC107796895 [Nicotiana tabacum]